MSKKELDLDGRIFAAMVGGFTAFGVSQVIKPAKQYAMPAAAVGVIVGSVALPKLFPKAYY